MNRLERRIIILLASLLSISIIANIIIIRQFHDKQHIEVPEYKKYLAKDNGMTTCIPLTYKGKIHGSVGVTYYIEYDTTAFQLKKNIEYNTPKEMKIGNCGGDGGFVTYSLYPHKVGEYIIYEVEGFRGEEIKRKKHKVCIEYNK